MIKYNFTIFNSLIKPSLLESLKSIDVDKAAYVLTASDKKRHMFSMYVPDFLLKKVDKILLKYNITSTDYSIYQDTVTAGMNIITIITINLDD